MAGFSARPKHCICSPGNSNGVRGCFLSNTFVAQCEMGALVADELLVQVLFVLLDIVDNGLNGGSGAGGNIPVSELSDQTGELFTL